MRELYEIPDRDRVCRAFAFAASQTWGEIRDFPELEEGSITDYRLLQLKRMCPEEITIIKFNKPKEAHTGADWEWWFGTDHEWFGMRVQAKRLDVPALEYSHLDHTIGKSGILQVDRLIADAAQRNLYAMYCFYNYWSPSDALPLWPCGTFAKREELWGASVADAEIVRDRIRTKSKKLGDIGPVSFPLMCLACCRGHAGGASDAPLPHRARGIAGVLSRRRDVPPLVPHPPWYATQAQSGKNLDLPAGVADLDGILIVEERPAIYEERQSREPRRPA